MNILDTNLQPSSASYDAAIKKKANEFQTSEPYMHCVFDPLCDPKFLAKVHDELTTNMKANFKETDLFKVFQTAELGSISEDSLRSTMPSFLQLREVLYSREFRSMMERITGCDTLIDRVDCSANAYANSCHLLCHDDVIGTRCISYIIYLSDPDELWQAHEGGAVELYPLDPESVVDQAGNGNLQGIPVASPTKLVLPTFNSMLFFTVQPGRSYHSVQEVFSKHRPRLSISGWYHAAQPPVGSDLSSLQQILSKGDRPQTFTPIAYAIPPTVESVSAPAPKGTVYGLTKAELRSLSAFLSADYLTKAAIDNIRNQFIEDSSVQLNNFLSSTVIEELVQQIVLADNQAKLGKGRPSLDYSVGLSDTWQLIGPPHKQRFLKYVPSEGEEESAAGRVGQLMQEIAEFLQSALFGKYLAAVTTMTVLEYQQDIRRFRPGLDYTVAHYSLLTKEQHLDATLCFVVDDYEVEQRILKEAEDEDQEAPSTAAAAGAGRKRKGAEKKQPKGKKQRKESNNDEVDTDDAVANEEEPDYDMAWADGDVGGFECFIEADEDAETAEAAEVYRQDEDDTAAAEDNGNAGGYGTSQKKNKKDESTLLSVSACNNSLSLVLRDEGIMKFVKYVSANAPGSRWDVATDYKVLKTDDSDEEEEDEDEEGGSEAEDDEAEDA